MAKKPTPPGDGERKPPAHEIRVGRLKLTIWRNHDGERGDWFSITLSRSYKDAQDKWHSAHTYGRDDALPAAEMFRLAWLWITTQTGGSGVADVMVPGGSPTNGDQDEIPI